MTEQETQLLTYTDVSEKVVLDAINCLDEFENTGEMILAPRGVSVALALADITKGGGK